MGVLSDRQIKHRAIAGMINPFVEEQIQPGVISYGLGHYGYDIRLGHNFRIFDSYSKMHGGVIDPKRDDWHSCFTNWYASKGRGVIIPPNSFALAESLETFDIPRDILVIVLGKSTYARCGLVVNVTPGEPEWKGKWTMELSNTSPLPLKVYPEEGIAQAIFFVGDEVCMVSYKDKKGRYQEQKGLTMPFVKPEEKVSQASQVHSEPDFVPDPDHD